MHVEQLLLALPSQSDPPTGRELNVHQWGALLDQFAAQGGREVLLGGAEPLGYPGFWPLVTRSRRASIPQVTAYLSGSLLEPWVVRGLVERGVYLLIALDSLAREPHEQLHGPGSHGRAMAAVETFLKMGLQERVGILATVSRSNHQELPALGAWAAGRGVSRFLWQFMSDTGWPSPQLRAMRLSPEERMAVAVQMQEIARALGHQLYMGPVDALEDPTSDGGFCHLLRVGGRGDACWGFSGTGGHLGNMSGLSLQELLNRSIQAAGD